MNAADKTAWGLALTAFGAAIGVDALSQAQIATPASGWAADMARLAVSLCALGFMIWVMAMTKPANGLTTRRFGAFDWLVFAIAGAPLLLTAAQGIANRFFDANMDAIVSRNLIVPGAILMVAWSLWLNRKYAGQKES